MNVRVTETWKMFFKILLCKDDVFALEKKFFMHMTCSGCSIQRAFAYK